MGPFPLKTGLVRAYFTTEDAEKTKSRQDKQKTCHPEPVEGRQVCHWSDIEEFMF